MKRKAVVLLSGGLDSAVSLWWAKKQGYQCEAVSFDYGQRHKKELRQAARLAKQAKISLHQVRFGLPWSESSLTDTKQALPSRTVAHMPKSIPSTYVPGRNTIFLSFALSLADQISAQAIVIGANAIDYSGYPDCRGPYLAAFEKTATLGSRLGTEAKKNISILAPLLRLTKKEIVLLGTKLGVPLHLTWSCYKGGAHPCGKCDSCRLRLKGFLEAGISGR